MQMTSYLHHNFVLMEETYPEILVKIRQEDVILRHLTSFSYIFPYYDVIDKNADVSKYNDVIVFFSMENKSTNGTLLSCNTPPLLHMFTGF